MNTSKGKKITACVIMGLLSLAGIYAEIVMCIQRKTFSFTVEAIITCAMFVLIVFYAVSNFKVPHGNLLKYLFLVFAACSLCGVLSVVTERTSADTVYNALRGVVVLLTAFVAGRLDRFKQNVILMSIIGVLMLASSITQISAELDGDFLGLFWCFTFFLLWADLMFAYILRYREHKEAGLADKN